jgi:hypothetical protein
MRAPTTRRGLVFAVALTAAFALSMSVAASDTLTVESFTNATVTDPAVWVAGGSGGNFTGWPGEACLTAGTDTSQSPVAGCDLDTPDAAGAGALRLTPATTGRAGFTLHNSALTTAGGLDITFQQAQWGGSGADGISFFLVDGATNLTQPGASGGALGYASGNGVTPGVAHGLIGVGIDTWGNFSATGSSGSGCSNPGPGQTPNRVVVRGPGNGTVGYCFLGTSGDVGDLDGASRAAATKTVRVVFDPDTVADRKVTVFLDGVQVVQVPAPAELIAATSFKFGFSAATGDVTNNNEVWNLTIESVNPVNPPAPPVPVGPNFTG